MIKNETEFVSRNYHIMKKFLLFILAAMTACTSPSDKKETAQSVEYISSSILKTAVDSVKAVHPDINMYMLEKGVRHASSLWRKEDGTPQEFITFVGRNFLADPSDRRSVFSKISFYFESLNGNFNEITLNLKKILDESVGKIDEIDRMFGNYSVYSHLLDDFYSNKIAFVIALNYPSFTLAEKEELGPGWSREEWAMARLGDLFVSRVPAELNQALTTATGNAEMYIAEYNIHMGKLRTDDNRQLFPDGMVLLSHWNLRDELKADYADREKGPEKQEMIYKVMERIINQEIPEDVINNPDYEWAPFLNKVTKGTEQIEAQREPDSRYSHIIDIFRAEKGIDACNPEMKTAILRKFSLEMEISQEEVESLFDTYLSSPRLIALGKIVRERLGRDLRPYDIWYNGFRSRSTISEDMLTAKTSKLYPNPAAFKAGMPSMLKKLGWSPDRAEYIADKIVVDPARGSGHAAGTAMKGSVSHLRTRISEKGMDYKGYNIAVHEFGHNVEQTISMYDVDYYMMTGVPNIAFTEALAFLFQSRDLYLLDIKQENKESEKTETLNSAWSLMEIMGVSMVEMKVWKWLYENPEATAASLKEATLKYSVEVWNKYFAPVIGVKDSPILAIYSHMVEVPLYLPNYAYGQIIENQIEEYIRDRKFSDEADRIFRQGKLTPQQWMKGATGTKISAQPLIDALDKALGN
jgi:hypothetical protein